MKGKEATAPRGQGQSLCCRRRGFSLSLAVLAVRLRDLPKSTWLCQSLGHSGFPISWSVLFIPYHTDRGRDRSEYREGRGKSSGFKIGAVRKDIQDSYYFGTGELWVVSALCVSVLPSNNFPAVTSAFSLGPW